MPYKQSNKNHLPSFVRLKTAQGMRSFAKSMAKMKREQGGIEEIAKVLRNQNLSEEQAEQLMANMSGLASKNVKEIDKVIRLLHQMESKVEKYVRSI